MLQAILSPDTVAVITGGASGIGLAAANRFARMGLRVCIADLDGNRLARAAETLSAVAQGGTESIMVMAADVSRAEDVQHGSVKNLGRYAASGIAWRPKRPSSTAALT